MAHLESMQRRNRRVTRAIGRDILAMRGELQQVITIPHMGKLWASAISILQAVTFAVTIYSVFHH